MCRIIAAITCLISLSVQAAAQTLGNALRDLPKIQLTIEDLDDNSIKCGLTADLIRSAVLYPTSSAKFQITNDLTPEALYVNTLSHFYESSQLCVTNLEMQVVSFNEVRLNFSGRKMVLGIQLWKKGYLASSDLSEHAHYVADAIEELAKKLVTDWNLDNKTAESDAGDSEHSLMKPVDSPVTPKKPLTLVPVEGNPRVPKTAAPNLPSGTLASETANVKFRGPVNLAPFKCDTIARSSFIQRVCYDASNSYMLINLSGTWYHYCEIGQGMVSSLLAAESMGRFYNVSIKGNFDCRTHRVPVY